MSSPYLTMTVLWLTLAVMAAVDAALVAAGMAPWFNGLRWLRVHFVTLGLLTEAAFGLLPGLVAAQVGRPRPAERWDIWLTLNAGLAALLVGMPLINPTWILLGGGLVFLAALLLLRQLLALGGAHDVAPGTRPGRPFYLAGTAFLLLGILVGTGLWLGWGPVLRIASVRELHIHANAFGFLALVFAGLIVSSYPDFAGRPLARPGSVRPIFWLMTLAALLAVVGPWLGLLPLTGLALVLELAAALGLLANVLLPLRGDPKLRTPGFVHLIAAYIWLAAPLLAAPFVLTGVAAARAEIEASAPQALIYGWALQLGYALLPYLLRRARVPAEPAALGGTWLSVVAVNLGALLLWAGIFTAGPAQAGLYAAAYALWALSFAPLAGSLWRAVRGEPEPPAPQEAPAAS